MLSNFARLVVVVITLASLISAAPAIGASSVGKTSCVFNLPLHPVDCARLVRSHMRILHPPARIGASRPTLGGATTLLYVAELAQAAIATFEVGGHGLTPAGQIDIADPDAAPTGLTVDRSQRLYAAVSSFSKGGPQEVLVYSRGGHQLLRTYQMGLTGPVGVAVSRGETLYVANLATPLAPGCSLLVGGGSVVEYAPGSLRPTAVLTDIPGCPNAVAVDANSNLYVSYYYILPSGLSQSDILEYSPGSNKGTPLGLKGSNENELFGIAFDDAGNLIVENSADFDSLNQILVYSRGSRTPKRIIQYGGYWTPRYFAILHDRLFAPAYIAEPVSMAAAEYAYPSGQQLAAQNPPGLFFYGFAVGSP